MISSHMGSTKGGWSSQYAILEVEEAKYQCDSVWIQNLDHFKLHFGFISWISKWSFNSTQLFSNGHNFFFIALICTLFETLDSWLL